KLAEGTESHLLERSVNKTPSHNKQLFPAHNIIVNVLCGDRCAQRYAATKSGRRVDDLAGLTFLKAETFGQIRVDPQTDHPTVVFIGRCNFNVDIPERI